MLFAIAAEGAVAYCLLRADEHSRMALKEPVLTVGSWPAAPVREPRRQLTLASSG
jgi:hypothetical protein